ncbi:MAG: hypothetical protein FJ382_07760, partial [Verrucomicrobia bacterium]|nr:hypothetical protein [Verrucomicrobiota bacterium]
MKAKPFVLVVLLVAHLLAIEGRAGTVTFAGISDPSLVRVDGWPKPSPEITRGMFLTSDVGVDSRGFIYVARRCEQPLLRLKPDGSLDRVIGGTVFTTSVFTDYDHGPPRPLGEKYWLHGLCIDAQDNVWITDVGRHLVFKFSPDGELLLTLGVDGVPGADGAHFNQPKPPPDPTPAKSGFLPVVVQRVGWTVRNGLTGLVPELGPRITRHHGPDHRLHRPTIDLRGLGGRGTCPQ